MHEGKGFGKKLNMQEFEFKSCVKIKYGIHTDFGLTDSFVLE